MKYTLNFMYVYTNILFSYKYIKFNVMKLNSNGVTQKYIKLHDIFNSDIHISAHLLAR